MNQGILCVEENLINFMSVYTVYVRCKYEGPDPTPQRFCCSIDVPDNLLAFVATLKDAILGEGMWEIDEISIIPPGGLCRVVPDEHFMSLDEFATHFGCIRFKPTTG